VRSHSAALWCVFMYELLLAYGMRFRRVGDTLKELMTQLVSNYARISSTEESSKLVQDMGARFHSGRCWARIHYSPEYEFSISHEEKFCDVSWNLYASFVTC